MFIDYCIYVKVDSMHFDSAYLRLRSAYKRRECILTDETNNYSL